MTHPLDDKNSHFLVLENALGQSSLWPPFMDVPAGWTVVFGAAPANECHAHIEARAAAAQGSAATVA
ncbi:MbtH family protein [Paracidovorax anthurii]|uniref:MbtH protein n=1 Tax=Paracidovorax anthurii TaxID=78229 RepID=A0A328ZDK4_9BURK|nr:MbtH family protein [Paracidovorax anthurii]RAR84320.1 MbtH protein [Paracidovorax anthurii]